MSPTLASSSIDVERLLLHTCNQGGSRSSQEKPTTLNYKFLVDPPLPSATITDLCNEPLFSNTYLSDEEDFSAFETDDMSFSTGTSKSLPEIDITDDDDFEATLPELLADECSLVEQQCNHAQAVMLVAAGRPKLIQVARVDIRSSPFLTRPSSSSSSSAHVLRRSGSSKKSINILSSRPGMQHSRTSSAASQSLPATPEIPSTPPLEYGVRTPMSACTPLTPETPASRFEFDHFSSPTRSGKSSSSTPTQKGFGRPKVLQRSKTSTLSLSETAPDRVAPLFSYKPKMIARAANERSPTMELPPFPDEYAVRRVRPSRPWMLRKDSFGPVHHQHRR